MSRGARAVINVGALQHNLNRVRLHAPGTQVVCVIKANGYGHGLERVARALPGAGAFGVASLDEALVLKKAGIPQPIMLLEGVFDPAELVEAQRLGLSLVVHQRAQVEWLEQASVAQGRCEIWLKVDTGMHRLGFPLEQVPEMLDRLGRCAAAITPINLMTHFGSADDVRDGATETQIRNFNSLPFAPGAKRTAANSAGLLGWAEAQFDVVRPGIMLFGVNPFLYGGGNAYELRPVMTLHTRLIDVAERRKGDRIGYGGSWECPEDMRVGVAAIGYGDGYPRHARCGTPVLVNGVRVPLIGRVSMDMITLDLRAVPGAKAGDDVVLWGDGLPVEEIADCASTIAYELLCGVAQRVEFVERHSD